MKRYVCSTSERALRYQRKQNNNELRRKYVQKLNDTLVKTIESQIHDKILYNPRLQRIIDDVYRSGRTLCYSTSRIPLSLEEVDNRNANCWVMRMRGDDCIEFHVNIYGFGRSLGLQWAADIETGGDGSNSVIYQSAMSSKQKQQIKAYSEQVASILEDAGFDVLDDAKKDSDGFWFPIINDEYEELL